MQLMPRLAEFAVLLRECSMILLSLEFGALRLTLRRAQFCAKSRPSRSGHCRDAGPLILKEIDTATVRAKLQHAPSLKCSIDFGKNAMGKMT